VFQMDPRAVEGATTTATSTSTRSFQMDPRAVEGSSRIARNSSVDSFRWTLVRLKAVDVDVNAKIGHVSDGPSCG